MNTKEENKQIHVYSASPKKLDPSELPWWKRFLGYALPWGKNKIIQGERYLESEIQVREADARLKNAQAKRELAETQRIMTEIARLKEETEEEEIFDVDFEEVDESSIAKELAELKAKFQALELKYNMEIEIKKRQEN